MGFKCTILSFNPCFRDLYEVCPFPGPSLLQEALAEAILDLCQGKPEHGRGTPEDARDVVLPPHTAHRDTVNELIGGGGVWWDEGAGHACKFCMAFVRECRVYLITVLDGDSGSIPESLPDHIWLLQIFQAFQDALVTEAEGPLHAEPGVFHEDEPEPFALQPHPQTIVGLGNQAFFREDLA